MFNIFMKIPISIFEHPSLGSVFVARKIADTIIKKQKLGEKCILGLATVDNFNLFRASKEKKRNKLSKCNYF